MERSLVVDPVEYELAFTVHVPPMGTSRVLVQVVEASLSAIRAEIDVHPRATRHVDVPPLHLRVLLLQDNNNVGNNGGEYTRVSMNSDGWIQSIDTATSHTTVRQSVRFLI